jgi:hypothetical protein
MAQTGDQTTLKLKRARAPTTTSELNPSLDSTKRGGQRRRVDDQNTAVPPTLHGGALGALNVHGDNVSKSLEGSHHKKMDGIGDQVGTMLSIWYSVDIKIRLPLRSLSTTTTTCTCQMYRRLKIF